VRYFWIFSRKPYSNISLFNSRTKLDTQPPVRPGNRTSDPRGCATTSDTNRSSKARSQVLSDLSIRVLLGRMITYFRDGWKEGTTHYIAENLQTKKPWTRTLKGCISNLGWWTESTYDRCYYANMYPDKYFKMKVLICFVGREKIDGALHRL
jgi:hypothetical protein